MALYSETLATMPPRPSSGAATPASLSAVIGRIEETIDAETTAIRSDPSFDLKASNARKSRGLYELNKAIRATRPEELDASHRAGLERLREKLKINEAAILAHLSAVGEVAALIQNAIQHAEADGTYSSSGFGGTYGE
ncbi:MAG: hypothetical protein H6893_02275 [Brucellaceae bacterium]|nr:hypothetical protein [Brucellaceae bacterium]